MTSFESDKTIVTATHNLKLVAVLADIHLLDHVNLIHADRHRHASGLIHSHPHNHVHEHL